MKKLLCMISVIGVIFSLVACTELTTFITTGETSSNTTMEDIEINVNTNSVTIIEEETYQLVVTSNDSIGLEYTVEDSEIITVSDTGYITALAEGVTTLTITSMSDEDVFQVVNVTVRKQIVLMSSQLSVTLVEGETNQLAITSNDEYEFEVTNDDIISVDEEGLITAKTEGVTTIIVTSTYDPETFITITVTVRKLISIDVTKSDYVLVVGDTEDLAVTSNDGLTYQSGDTGIVTVDENGQLTAIGFGYTFIRIRSTYDTDMMVDVDVVVYKYTEEIEINGSELLICGMSSQLTTSAAPVGSYNVVTWESSDELVLTVDETGLVTAVASGSATIIARSVLDDSIADTINITVVNVLIVDSTKEDGDTYLYETLELSYGVQLFSSIQEAINNATEDAIIYIETGTYTENIGIPTNGLVIQALEGEVVFSGVVTLTADDVTISGISFVGESRLFNPFPIINLTFSNNSVRDITYTASAFLTLYDTTNTKIIENSFLRLAGSAIALVDFKGELTEIKKNTFDDCDTAISVDAESTLLASDEIRIFWNEITNVEVAFMINMLVGEVEQDIFKVARFNKVTNYTTGAIVNIGSVFDLTLNYWGSEPLDYNLFTNVDEYYLKGNYSDPLLVPTESTYNPNLPIIITITNPIDEIMIGETWTFEYEILPYELQDAPVRFITGYPDLISINQDGVITPLSSGDVYIQIRSALLSTIRTQIDFSVITTPGIEITSTNVYSDVQVGDTFTLGTILFPYTIEGETASITSSAPSVASIDGAGLVTANAEGLVTFRATLDNYPDVYVEYTIYVQGMLDPDANLLDYLTTLQISYSAIHEWTAFGFQYDYYDTRAESVSRYYFGDISINNI